MQNHERDWRRLNQHKGQKIKLSPGEELQVYELLQQRDAALVRARTSGDYSARDFLQQELNYVRPGIKIFADDKAKTWRAAALTSSAASATGVSVKSGRAVYSSEVRAASASIIQSLYRARKPR